MRYSKLFIYTVLFAYVSALALSKDDNTESISNTESESDEQFITKEREEELLDTISDLEEQLDAEISLRKQLKALKKEISELEIFDESFYAEKLKLTKQNHRNEFKFRKDVDGGLSNVMFRVKRVERPGLRDEKVPVAIKIYSEDAVVDYGDYVDGLDQGLNEWQIAQTLRNFDMHYIANIHKAYRSEDNESIYLVMDYVNGKNALKNVFAQKQIVFDQKQIVANAARIGETLFLLKRAGIIFRDLKMQNMLLNQSQQIFIIDFGLAAILSYQEKGFVDDFCGTVFTMAPEVLDEEPQDYQVDVWSFGIVLYQFFTGSKYPERPFGDSDEENQIKYAEDVRMNMKTLKINYNEKLFRGPEGKLAVDLIKHMLVIDADERFTIEKILRHEWFSSQSYYFDHLLNAGRNMHRIDKAAPPSKPYATDILQVDEDVESRFKQPTKRVNRNRGHSGKLWAQRPHQSLSSLQKYDNQKRARPKAEKNKRLETLRLVDSRRKSKRKAIDQNLSNKNDTPFVVIQQCLSSETRVMELLIKNTTTNEISTCVLRATRQKPSGEDSRGKSGLWNSGITPHELNAVPSRPAESSQVRGVSEASHATKKHTKNASNIAENERKRNVTRGTQNTQHARNTTGKEQPTRRVNHHGAAGAGGSHRQKNSGQKQKHSRPE